MSPRGPETLAFANKKLCKAVRRNNIYIYIYIYIILFLNFIFKFFFVAFRIPRVQRSPIIGVHRFLLSKENLAYLLWLMMMRSKVKK